MMYNNVNYITHQAPRISYHAGMRYTLCEQEGILERLFFREKTRQDFGYLEEGVMMDRQKFVVGVTGIGAGAGATFTAMGLAFKMGEMTSGVTYLEGQPHRKESVSPYRLLALDRDFRRTAEKNGHRAGRLNLYKKVNWQIHRPEEAKSAASGTFEGKDEQHSHREKAMPTDIRQLTTNYRQLPGRIIIVDNPIFFDELDLVVAVIDPFPPRISAGLESYKKIREVAAKGGPQHRDVIWLINKSDEGMARRETERFLKLKFDFEQRLLPEEGFYKAAYSCIQPYFMCETEGLDRLASKILNSI